jgi:hypothetical protein
MPSYAEVLTDTYLPAQAAKLRWESAKTVAGAQFDALAEQRKAVDEVRLRRQQYAENIRTREGSADAFMFQAMQAQAGVQAPGKGGGGGGTREAVDAGVNAIRALPGSTVFKTGSAEEQLVRNTFNAAKSVEQKQRVIEAAASRGFQGSLVIPAGTPSEKAVEKKAREGDAAAQAQYLELVGRAQATIDLADNLGPRGFQGGTKAREFYENLTNEQQELARVYASALLDDGVVTAEEVPVGQLEEARKLHGQIEAKGAYRLQDKAAFDQGYLDLLKDLSTKEGALKDVEGRLQGKTKETLAEELYMGASERAAIPPLLRSLEPEMKGFLDGYTAAQGADPKTDPESYLRSQLSDREVKGFSAASAMAASGMRAADIMDNLQALSPEERRKVMGALASRDAIASTQVRVAPGTPLPEIQKIQTEDRRAQEAELARTESRLQRRLREIDESLAAGRESGFGGIVSPDTGARRAPVDPRREVLMGALSPDAEAAEVERIATERADRLRAADEGLETPEEVAAVEEFRRRQAGQGMGLTREQLLMNISEEPRMDFERMRLRAQEDGKSSPVPMDLPVTPQGRAFTPADRLEAPAPAPADTRRRVDLDEPAPAPAPAAKPVSEMTDEELEAFIKSGGR